MVGFFVVLGFFAVTGFLVDVFEVVVCVVSVTGSGVGVSWVVTGGHSQFAARCSAAMISLSLGLYFLLNWRRAK